MVTDKQLALLLIYIALFKTKGPFFLKSIEQILTEDNLVNVDVNLSIKMLEKFLDNHFEENTQNAKSSSLLPNLRRLPKKSGWLYSLNLLIPTNEKYCAHVVKVALNEINAYYKINMNGQIIRYIEHTNNLLLTESPIQKIWIWSEQFNLPLRRNSLF